MFKRRLRGDRIAFFEHLKGCHLEDGRELLLLAAEDRTHKNEFKLQVAECEINII